MSIPPSQEPKGPRWTRSYPPLIVLGAALAIAVLILPSSLNLPQSNPTTVLEYAPVPPEQDEPPPPEGNVQALGLGASRTIAEQAEPPPLPPPAADVGIGGRPRQKRCVGNPPRQTEDPASPPCAPFFEGDNFGDTYQGVEREEILVLVYFDWGAYGLTGQLETTPAPGTYVDVDKPRLPNCPPDNGAVSSTDPDQCDHVLIRMLRGFSRYFNERFQTYDRRVHYWAYFTNVQTAAGRRADAVANWERIRPFAVLDAATFNGFNQEYQEAMTQLGVLTFSSQEAGLENEFYRRIAPLGWGFWPDLERAERLYSSYVCQKVVPYPVRRFGTGSGGPNGGPRTFGIFYPNDPAEPGLERFSELVIESVEQCGVEPIVATYSKSGYAVDGEDTGTDAAQAVALFQQADVTTVLYIGTETRFSNAADAIRYYPEIVVAGNLNNDNNFIAQSQNQNTWRNAWALSFHIRINRLEDSPGYRAYKEGDPQGDANAGVFSRDLYRDHFMLFQGIQVAGPQLTPESVEKGFHAIPERPSTDPFVAAFFFDEGDYTSTKDAIEMWWDPAGRSRGGGTPSRRPGCWRTVREGQRFLAGQWEGEDDVFRDSNDPCTGYDGSIRLRA